MSDFELRAYQRLAKTHADDSSSLWRYITALERHFGFSATSVEAKPPTLQTHIDLTLVASGLTDISEICLFDTIPPFRDFVARLFPYGKLRQFASEEWDPDMYAQDCLLVDTGIHDEIIPEVLSDMLRDKALGSLFWPDDGSIIWLAPYAPVDNSWCSLVSERPSAGSPPDAYPAWRRAYSTAWETQKIIYNGAPQ